MNKPKVSIITVVYNLIENKRVETFIQTIESIKNQTYKNIEYIIIDGKSSDGTIDLLQKLNLKFISEKDNGIYDAMNKGINLATGKYITFINSDDFYCDNNAIQIMLSSLEQNNADWAFANTKYIDKDENIVNGILQEKPDIKNLFLTMPFSHQSMFIKTDILKKLKFDTKYKIVADYNLTFYLFLNKYKYLYIDKYIVTFRLGGICNKPEFQEVVNNETIDIYINIYKKLGIKLNTTQVKEIQYKKNIPYKIIKILRKKFKINFYKSLFYNEKYIQTQHIKLFGFLPILTIELYQNKKRIYLFKFIKILSIRWKIC